MRMTVAPPVVHPSLGLIALMHGVAAYPRQREEQIQHLGFTTRILRLFFFPTQTHHCITLTCLNDMSQRHTMEIALWKKRKK